MGVLFLVLFSLLIIRDCDASIFPGRKFPLHLLVMAIGGFEVKCVSEYWELILRNVDGIGI